MPFLIILLGAGLVLLASWAVMLLVDPATAGLYTVSYEQAVAITVLASILFGGSNVARLND